MSHDTADQEHGGLHAAYRWASCRNSLLVLLGALYRRGSTNGRSAGQRGRAGKPSVSLAGDGARRPAQRSRARSVIRPGANLYEVNDHVEVAAIPPVYGANDIYVVGCRCWTHRAVGIAGVARFSQAEEELSHSALAGNTTAAPELQGSIVLHVQPLKGQEALLVTGEAPPSVPVRITLLGTLSSDLPNVLLSRHDIIRALRERFKRSCRSLRLLPQQLHSRARDFRSGSHVGERADPGRCAERRRRSSRRSTTRRNLETLKPTDAKVKPEPTDNEL